LAEKVPCHYVLVNPVASPNSRKNITTQLKEKYTAYAEGMRTPDFCQLIKRNKPMHGIYKIKSLISTQSYSSVIVIVSMQTKSQ
jgi:hypothetical protein